MVTHVIHKLILYQSPDIFFYLGLYKKTKDVKTRVIECTTIVSSDRFDTLKKTDKNWIHTYAQSVY